MTLFKRRLIVLTWMALCACGASETTAVTPDEGPLAGELVDAAGNPAPAWVTAPSNYRKDAEGLKVVCGEGSVGGTANMSLAQNGAAGRARENLALAVETKVAAMLHDYQSTTTGGGQFGAAANDEQHLVDTSRQITERTLSGTEVNETWISSKSTLHSLVCLNVERFKGSVKGMQELDEATRAAVVERAEKAWGELDQSTAPAP